MKNTIHARLTDEDRTILEELRQATGKSDSELIRQGLRLMIKERARPVSALELAGTSVGKFKRGPRDLSINPKHLQGFGG